MLTVAYRLYTALMSAESHHSLSRAVDCRTNELLRTSDPPGSSMFLTFMHDAVRTQTRGIFHQIYAVYNRSRKLLVILSGLFLAEAASTLALLDLALNRLGATGLEISVRLPGVVIPVSELEGCFSVSSQAYFFIWLPPLIFETILCLLMLYKAWGLYADDWGNPLLNLIIRDRYAAYHQPSTRRKS
jgi:hypothetical protein